MRVFYLRTQHPPVIGSEHVARIDTKELSLEEAAKLFNLVESANFFSLPSKILSPETRSQGFDYDLTIKFAGEQHTVFTQDVAVPSSLKPLLEWSEGKADNEPIIPQTLQLDAEFLKDC